MSPPQQLPHSRTDTPASDVICIGAGIVGLATAMHLSQRTDARVTVLEAESEIAGHQTGHNSGVIHSGLYYTPGSLKARNCVEGRRRLLRHCDEHDVAYELCGKLVIATERSELSRLDELQRRGLANGLTGMQRLEGERIPEFEPHATGLAALWIPETGIVDYVEVARSYADVFEHSGGRLQLDSRVSSIAKRGEEFYVETSRGAYRARHLINCAGLQCDRIARLAGAHPKVRIVPFRGDYFDLREERRSLLRGLIYPVPDPRFPFLGVHLTKRLDGSVEAGPNAVLALHREGYDRQASLRDAASSLLFPGTWALGLKYWRIAATEFARAGSPARFAKALRRYVPEIEAEDLTAGGCGIRAQALSATGRLLDDFAIERSAGALHLLNAPSPAATASLAIGEDLCTIACEHFGLRRLDGGKRAS